MTHSRSLLTIGCILALAIAPSSVSTVFAQDTPLTLAGSRPTPCLDSVAPLLVSEMVQSGTRAFLDGIGRNKHFSSEWAPGNNFYDQAFSISYKALNSDELFATQLQNLSAKTFLLLKFRRALPEEQEYLRSFFNSTEGSIYWDYILEGAHCQGLFEGVFKRRVLLTQDQRDIAGIWRQTLSTKRKNFEMTFSKLTQTQKSNFDKGYKLLSRLSKSEAADEQAFQLSLVSSDQIQQAAERSLLPVMNEVFLLVNEFARNQR